MSFDGRLLDLLVRYEELQARGEAPDAEEFCRDCPELLAELRSRIEDLQALQPRLQATARGPVPGATPPLAPAAGPGAPTGAPPIPGGMRYRPLQAHARGGLGEVLLAQDEELQRPVALKRMQPQRRHDPALQRRFLLEAQVTARLEHPGVVPVYGLVRDAEGQPCYAMRFIRGETLKEAIERFHRADGPARAAGERNLALRDLLQRFLTVCNTIAYAHSQGVLHRDLKPGNVMLGPYGETLVVDWGLAKHLGQPVGGTGPDGPPGAAGGGSTVQGSTEMGEVIGTPLYASPEQAAGRWDLVGTASDIYSLGATLFVLLTGEPPFGGRSTAELLDKVKRGEVVPPRRLKKEVPAALEAVCLKAMARRPQDRYATALELAADLEHWLADEPVSVYPEGGWERLLRWTRRHRTGAQAAAVTLLLVTATSVVAALLVNQAREDEAQAKAHAETARDTAAAARDEASRRFREALRATDKWSTGVSLVLDKYYPDLPDAREQLLEEAARDYERWASEKSDDRQLQADSGQALLRLGDVRRLLHKPAVAETAYLAAEALFAELCRADPATPGYRLGLANSRTRLGIVRAEPERAEAAREAYRTALADLRALVREYPDEADYRDALGTLLINYGAFLDQTGEPAAAEQALGEAVTLFERLAGERPALPRYAQAVITAHEVLGRVVGSAGRKADAVALHRKAMDFLNELVRRHPESQDYQEERAECRVRLANALRALGQTDEEARAYRESIADYEALKSQPGRDALRDESLALTRVDLGQVLHLLGQNSAARTQLEAALAQFTALARRYADSPRSPGYQQARAAARDVLGGVLADFGLYQEAEAAHRDAVRTLEELAEKYPQVSDYVHRLAVGRTNLARTLHRQGRHPEAEELFRTAVDSLRDLLAEGRLPEYQDALAWTYTYQGDLFWDAGRQAEAAAAYEAARDERVKLVARFAQPEYLTELSLLLADCPDAHLRDPERAVREARRAVQSAPQSGRAWGALGIACYRAGRWQEAVEALEKALASSAFADPLHQFFLAMARQRAGLPAPARQAYDQAVAGMAKNSPHRRELERAGAEAAALLNPPWPPK